MNELIKELATKAQLEHCVSHVRLQEFAELIVLECSNIAEAKEQGDSKYEKDMSVGWYIRQRFGVK
jgi:hypothetical protein